MSHVNTGRWMRSYSVSYVSKTDSSPSASACWAGAIVESSKVRCIKSIGREEIFSNVMRMEDLRQHQSQRLEDRAVISPFAIVQHQSTVCQRSSPDAQQRLLRHNFTLQEPLGRRTRRWCSGADPLRLSLPWPRIEPRTFESSRFALDCPAAMGSTGLFFVRRSRQEELSGGATGRLHDASSYRQQSSF